MLASAGSLTLAARLGGLINRGRYRQAVDTLEIGLRVHPDDPIMATRLAEARKRLTTAGAPGFISWFDETCGRKAA